MKIRVIAYLKPYHRFIPKNIKHPFVFSFNSEIDLAIDYDLLYLLIARRAITTGGVTISISNFNPRTRVLRGFGVLGGESPKYLEELLKQGWKPRMDAIKASGMPWPFPSPALSA